MRMSADAIMRQCETKHVDLALDAVDNDGSFSGYASLFGRMDMAGDIVEPGAFAKSLGRKGTAGIRMLFQHDPNQPIGAWAQLREDARGLFVRGQLALGTERAREVLSLMRSGALDGLSIGFRTIRARKDGAKGVRRILEADLWEISIVTFPMLPEARIQTVKARTLPTIREFECWLTRDAGLTRSEARAVIANGFASLAAERDAAPGTTGNLAATIRQATRMIRPTGMKQI
jgi:HK97 family phage prohead protease